MLIRGNYILFFISIFSRFLLLLIANWNDFNFLERHLFSFDKNFKDYSEIIAPLDNLATHYIYSKDMPTPYAGRVPSYFIPYVPLRIMLNERMTVFLSRMFNLFLFGISSVVLFNLVKRIFKDDFLAILGFLLYNFVPYFWYWEWYLHPYSISNSLTVFMLYLVYDFINTSSYHYRLKVTSLLGLVIFWMFLLRPYNGVYFILAFLIIYYLRNDMKKLMLSLILFFSPLFIFESIWMCRNYLQFKKIIPLQTSYTAGYEWLELTRELVSVWGGKTFWYFKESDMQWFRKEGISFKLPSYVVLKNFNLDSLNILRNDILKCFYSDIEKEEKSLLLSSIKRRIGVYREEFKRERWYFYYFITPLKRLRNYLLENPVQDWVTSNKGFHLKIIKGISVIEYLIVLVSIFIYPFFWKSSRENLSYFSILFVLIFLNLIEFVYLIPAQHFLYFQNTYIISLFILLFEIFLLIGTNVKKVKVNL